VEKCIHSYSESQLKNIFFDRKYLTSIRWFNFH